MPSEFRVFRFRIFSGKDREGFEFFHNFEIPQLILEDLLFQLFQDFFPAILCPEVYYFSDSEVMLSYTQLKDHSAGFIYVHFVERVAQYKQENKLQKPFRLCDLDKIAKGHGLEGNRLFIFSEKQFSVYRNKKYCDIVNNRIDELSDHFQRQIQATQSFNAMLSKINSGLEKSEQDIMALDFQYQIKKVTDKAAKLEQLSIQLQKAERIIKEGLKQAGIYLKGLDEL